LRRFLVRADTSLVLDLRGCDNQHIGTNLTIDDRLIEEARKSGNHKTKEEAVTIALQEYIQRRGQRRVLKAFGAIDFDPSYNYKAEL
jgi:Arc/MetJ family transcription regulator